MRKTVFAAFAGTLIVAASAVAEVPDRPTFTKDILPILQENCITCHRPEGLNMSGMIAPMSLMTYEEVRPWSKAIARVTQNREMPPWHAAPEQHGQFSNERTLTEDQIATIQKWVQTGAKRGNPNDAPAPIEYPATGWNIGEPDLIAEFDEPYFVEDEVEDLYHDVHVTLTEEQLPEDKWIEKLEFKPGSSVVHHILGYATAPGETPSRGREGRRDGFFGGNAPGTDPIDFDDGFGILLKKGSTVTFAMHYHKEPGPGTGVYDSSAIGFVFHDEEVTHPVAIYPIEHGAFEIPPQHSAWRVGGAKLYEEDTYLLGMTPHTHLRGAYAKYTAFYPDGTSEVLLEVPRYDFNWQTSYSFKEPKVLPAGTRVEMELLYDNSEQNAMENGFNPQRAVRFGGPTTDEMDLAWISTTPVEPQKVSDADSGESSPSAGN